jgi:hypothetical protein
VDDAIAQIVQHNRAATGGLGSSSSSSAGSDALGKRTAPQDAARARARKKTKTAAPVAGAQTIAAGTSSKPKMTVDVGFKIQSVAASVRDELNLGLGDMLTHFEAEKEKARGAAQLLLPVNAHGRPSARRRVDSVPQDEVSLSPPAYDADGDCLSADDALREISRHPHVCAAFYGNPFRFLLDNIGAVSVSQYLFLLAHAGSADDSADVYPWTLTPISAVQRACFEYLVGVIEQDEAEDGRPSCDELALLLLSYGLFRIEAVAGVHTDICVYMLMLRAVRDRFTAGAAARGDSALMTLLGDVEVQLKQHFTFLFGDELLIDKVSCSN